MTRTTPPRPVDVVAVFPELADYARVATRLHPRPGSPTITDSSVGGPLLWPADEPWPVCREEHPGGWDWSQRPDDVRESRRILTDAWGQDPSLDWGNLPDDMRNLVTRIQDQGSDLSPDDAIPLLPIAQLFLRDVPGLVAPQGADVLQVLWCAADHAGEWMPTVALHWRRSSDVGDVRLDPPEPTVVEKAEYLPVPCVLHPEQVTEYASTVCLPDLLADRITDWSEEREDQDGIHYQLDLSVAPGWKVGGWAPHSFRDVMPSPCTECGGPMLPLLYIGIEGGTTWEPLEDGYADKNPFTTGYTGISLARGGLQIYICAASADHPHQEWMQ